MTPDNGGIAGTSPPEASPTRVAYATAVVMMRRAVEEHAPYACFTAEARGHDTFASDVARYCLDALLSLPVEQRMEVMGMAPWSSNWNDHLHQSAGQQPPKLWKEADRG